MWIQRPRLRGRAGQSILFAIYDAATPFQPKSGLAFGSVTASYCTPTSGRVAITPVTQTPTGAWVSGGFVEIDATNQPGVYRFDIPNAVWNQVDASQEVIISIKATGYEPTHILCPLTDFKDEQVDVGSVRVNS